ncbi:hypothetical protein NLU13_3205 [Sarocladium strictum]|uniref:Zn(2)-C6 fungal-type domain-containing protein n=1 Tax=Sarocladium strictum TaxID=5046 RepID=A0AA39LA73_SARSR|nr:hypothetical protein NLU13_3205 [Sarocladium strictum]
MAFRSRGLPSRGCNKCRSKKIRCDETKPICQNCIRVAYTECKYRDEFERTWRIHTEKTVEKAVEKAAKRPDSPVCPILARFFYDWTTGKAGAPGASLSWLDGLPTMYENVNQGGLLHQSVLALAHVNHGKRCGDAESIEKGTKYYGEALRKMREIISADHDTSLRDVLASAVLLGVHEAFVDPSISPSGSWLSHACGASVFLNRKIDPSKLSQSPVDLQIRSMVFRQTLHGSLVSGRRPPLSLDHDRILDSPALQYVQDSTKLLYKATLLCSEWRSVLTDLHVTSDLDRLAKVAEHALSLDGELEQWERLLPSPFRYKPRPIAVSEATPDWLRHLLTSPGAPSSWHEPDGPLSEMLWRFHWEVRMILCQALLHTNLVLGSQDSSINPMRGREGEVESRLLNIIDRLCEACITPLIMASDKTSAAATGPKIEDIPSIRGYLMLHILPGVNLCLRQTVIRSVDVDLRDRRTWVQAMGDFVQFRLGFTKAAAEIDTIRLRKLPIQLWSFGSEDCWSLGRQESSAASEALAEMDGSFR